MYPNDKDSSAGAAAISVLLHLTEALTQDHPLEDSLRAITDAVLVLLPCDHASVRLLDASSTSLLSGARSGVGTPHSPMTFRRGEGVLGWAVEHGESVRVADARTDGRFLGGFQQQGFMVRSILVEPLWSAGNVVGVLTASSGEASKFSDDDQLLCRLLANCSVPPIEKARLKRLTITDDNTLAYNQRYLFPRLLEEMERSRRNALPVSMLLMDLDHFKRVNDIHGHAVGDTVLRMFADRVRGEVRRIDVLVRRGGEEFVLIMPQTATEQAQVTADRIRHNLADLPIVVADGVALKQTVSIGVATWDGKESAGQFEHRADEAMYGAKQSGRNRISVAPAGLRV